MDEEIRTVLDMDSLNLTATMDRSQGVVFLCQTGRSRQKAPVEYRTMWSVVFTGTSETHQPLYRSGPHLDNITVPESLSFPANRWFEFIIKNNFILGVLWGKLKIEKVKLKRDATNLIKSSFRAMSLVIWLAGNARMNPQTVWGGRSI